MGQQQSRLLKINCIPSVLCKQNIYFSIILLKQIVSITQSKYFVAKIVIFFNNEIVNLVLFYLFVVYSYVWLFKNLIKLFLLDFSIGKFI